MSSSIRGKCLEEGPHVIQALEIVEINVQREGTRILGEVRKIPQVDVMPHHFARRRRDLLDQALEQRVLLQPDGIEVGAGLSKHVDEDGRVAGLVRLPRWDRHVIRCDPEDF